MGLGTTETRTMSFRKAKTTNATDTSFPSKIPTATKPSGDGVHPLAGPGMAVQSSVMVVPYLLGDDDDVFAMRIIGWRSIGPEAPGTALWIPVVLAELTCTGGTSVGVAGKTILNTERFCDTIALVTGNEDISIDFVSPTGNVIAHAVLDLKGSELIEWTFDTTTGDPVSVNCLFALL